METLSRCVLPSGIVDPSPSRQPPIRSPLKAPTFRNGYPRTHENFEALRLSRCEPSAPRCRSGIPRAVSHDVSDSGSGEPPAPGNGDEGSPSWLQELISFQLLASYFGRISSAHWHAYDALTKSYSNHNVSEEKGITGKSEMTPPVTGGSGTSGSRAGLFRTPISGGVQSATSAHDLPRPALAVRNLMEQARFAHLCTVMSQMHHRRAGYPFGSLVDFAPDSMGHPIFSLSPLAIHTRNLLADPRSTLVVQIPGWSGLSNARVTIFGDVVPLPADQQEWARKQYIAKHQQWASHQWGNFYYYRMQSISDIYFIGGFGTVAWVDVREYEALQPDKIAADGGEQNLKELNAIFSKPLKEILSTEVEIDDAALISIDSKGIDIRVRQGAQFNIQRLSFEVEHEVETLEEAKKALQRIIYESSRSRSHNRG